MSGLSRRKLLRNDAGAVAAAAGAGLNVGWDDSTSASIYLGRGISAFE